MSRPRRRAALVALALGVAVAAAHAADDGPAPATTAPRPTLLRLRDRLPWRVRRARAAQAAGETPEARPGSNAASSSGAAGVPEGSTSTSAGGPPRAITQPGQPGAPEVAGTAAAPGSTGATGVPEAPTPLLLNKALGLQEAPFRVFGWIENSFTGNADGTPHDRQNFGVYPNHLANSWMGNQYYVALENPLVRGDTVDFGWRFDTLFGNDWQFTKSYGLFDRAFATNHFAGVDLPQIYGEVHLPILTRGGVDIRGGRFFSLTGFESPQAMARPLLSVPYTMNFTPFTYFGAIATLHINDRLSTFGGTINGFDRWIDARYKWGYIGALTWTARDQKTTVVVGGACVPDQLPSYPPANSPFLPVGVTPPPTLSGRPNLLYGGNYRGYIVAVLTHNWSKKLTEAFETCQVTDPNILGFGGDPAVIHSAAYHGAVHWFLYHFNDKYTGVFRSELFWDPYGLATGVRDTFAEMTVGLNAHVTPWLWVRPEARYDWAQHTHPFADGTRKSQLTLAFDVIVLF